MQSSPDERDTPSAAFEEDELDSSNGDFASSTASQQILADFCNVTGANLDTAKHYLSAAANDIDIAIGLYMEAGPVEAAPRSIPFPNAPPADRHQHPRPSSSASNVANITPIGTPNEAGNHGFGAFAQDEDVQAIRAPMQPRSAVLTGDLDSDDDDAYPVFASNVSASSRARPAALGSVWGNTAGSGVFAGNSAGIASQIIEPFREVYAESAVETERSQRLANLFRPPFSIIFQGTFEQARRQARETSRWLLVTIHEATEFACQVMNRDLWNDDAAQAFIKENFVFMQLNSGLTEAQRYTSYYPFNSQHPHIAIIDPRTGERVISWNAIQFSPGEFLQEVSEFLVNHPLALPSPSSATPSQQQLPKPNNLAKRPNPVQAGTAISNAAPDMPASLHGSAASFVTANAAADTTAVSPISPASYAAIEKATDPRAKSPRLAMFDFEEPSIGTPDATTIQFRLPNGTKIRRRFLLTDPLNRLDAFIASNQAGLLPTLGDFELLLHTKPLKDYPPETTTLRDAGLANSTINVVTL